MIVRKVDIKNLEEKKDELEITIESNQKEFRNLINSINRQCGEIEEINSELSMMKANVKEMKQTAKELVEFDESDKEKLSSVLDRLNEINREEPEYIKPSDKKRHKNELKLNRFIPAT